MVFAHFQQDIAKIGGNKAKVRISKRVFQESKARQNFRKTNIPLHKCAYQEVRNVCFSEILTCFTFLKHPFWDSPFCLIPDEIISKLIQKIKKILVVYKPVRIIQDWSDYRLSRRIMKLNFTAVLFNIAALSEMYPLPRAVTKSSFGLYQDVFFQLRTVSDVTVKGHP